VRIAPAAAAVALLILLLTWLSLRAFNTDAERFDLAFGEMDRFETLEAALHRDVLSARAGMLRNYDPLVWETHALNASLDRLREIVAADAATDAAIDGLAKSVARQEELVEQFKSNNALLGNSLAYFGLFSSRLASPDQRGALGPSVATLATAMLRLTLDTSPVTVQEVNDRLDELAVQIVPPNDAGDVQALLAHGRLLQSLLPTIDGILKAMYALPRNRDQEALRTIMLARQSESWASARQFQTLLYIASLQLVGLLVHLGLRLRARALRLRRRAAFERVITGISMHFISTAPRDFKMAVERALADMARWVGADRAYLVFSGRAARIYTWHGPGMEFGPGWPDSAPALVARFSPGVERVMYAPQVNRLPPGDCREAVAAAGLLGWACVARATSDGVNVLLGFDAVGHPSRMTRTGELDLLRIALDAIVNVVRRHTLEQERTRLEARLLQARHLETVGAFASGIAHNFNNIVGAILGYTEMADEQTTSDHQSSRIIREIRRAGERARELVDGILTFARHRDTHRHPVNMHALISESILLLRASLPAMVEITVREIPEPAFVSGMLAQLQQVILNLGDNAAKAMDYDGCVEIEAAIVVVDPRSARALSHGDLAPGNYVRIAVSDAGCGMDEAVLERIFEPFFTMRPGGSGLGLATVRDIVREHDGAIDVRSTVGTGSRFEVWLPRIAVPTAVRDNDSDTTLPLGHGETVMVVEGDVERLPRDEEVLAALGYEPVGFTTAADARSALRQTPERFDGAVVGHVGSTMATLELAASMHEIAPDLPILLATVSADEIGAETLIAAGIMDVVPRPVVASDIGAALAACFAAKRSAGAAPFSSDHDARVSWAKRLHLSLSPL
jgi:signal transduction histidine kinase/CheY-like chemotaxis protein